ncbi:MAG: NADH-quinone oxidoreductase subunit L [Euryarchaeota archaeon]|nr:NADH-quinone oxidoreductase subunit L [Euryarchaeota archaeon]
MIENAWLIPVLPAAAFLIIGAFTMMKRELPEGGGPIALLGVGGGFVVSIGVVLDVLGGKVELPYHATASWFVSPPYTFTVGIFIDRLTALMLIVVGLVATLVVVYSHSYMREEGLGRRRYYAEICLFVSSMLALVIADNYLEVFITWELVGLCSYLLIGYWYKKPEAATAAKKAFLVTRIGDILFLIGIIILLATFKTFDFTTLFSMTVPADQTPILTIAMLCIFGGAVGKSAQFPLHVWLPDAMEGPTTVSALIHAATMVKAGVYLVARSYPLFTQAPDALMWVAIIGGFTAFLAASMALVAYDIKRVLAYSTVSQLAYMFLGLGAGAALVGTTVAAEGWTTSQFHLMNHAFFKALLFLGAGSVIHAVHTNDMREMGGLRKFMPVTAITFLLASLSIAGIPPLSGFWSKDELLATVFLATSHPTYGTTFLILYVLGVLTALMTAFYMFRLYFMTFEGKHRGATHVAHHPGEHHGTPHESPLKMTGPLLVLAVLAVGSGLWAVSTGGFASTFHVGEAEHHSAGFGEILAETFASPLTYVSIVAGVGGILLAYLVYSKGSIDPDHVKRTWGAPFHLVLTKKYYMDDLYGAFANRVVLGAAAVIDWFDEHVIDAVVNGISTTGQSGSESARKQTSGNVQDYAAWMIGGLVVLFMFVIYIVPRLPRGGL